MFDSGVAGGINLTLFFFTGSDWGKQPASLSLSLKLQVLELDTTLGCFVSTTHRSWVMT